MKTIQVFQSVSSNSSNLSGSTVIKPRACVGREHLRLVRFRRLLIHRLTWEEEPDISIISKSTVVQHVIPSIGLGASVVVVLGVAGSRRHPVVWLQASPWVELHRQKLRRLGRVMIGVQIRGVSTEGLVQIVIHGVSIIHVGRLVHIEMVVWLELAEMVLIEGLVGIHSKNHELLAQVDLIFVWSIDETDEEIQSQK